MFWYSVSDLPVSIIPDRAMFMLSAADTETAGITINEPSVGFAMADKVGVTNGPSCPLMLAKRLYLPLLSILGLGTVGSKP